MADCRFSSMNWRCELYVYESDDGVVINVRNGRLKDGALPHPDLGGYPLAGTETEKKEWWRQDRENTEAIDREDCFEPINTPSAGQSFHRLSPARAAIILRDLKDEGIIFPDYVLEDYRDTIGQLDEDREDRNLPYEEALLAGTRRTLERLADREDMLAGYEHRNKKQREAAAERNKELLGEAIASINTCIAQWEQPPR